MIPEVHASVSAPRAVWVERELGRDNPHKTFAAILVDDNGEETRYSFALNLTREQAESIHAALGSALHGDGSLCGPPDTDDEHGVLLVVREPDIAALERARDEIASEWEGTTAFAGANISPAAAPGDGSDIRRAYDRIVALIASAKGTA